ncbi:hypothetical protein E2C01_034591 [Portunus trituberculatus]|uniref:Uncharacterized protein n=1 Tax=Portunus trituberculatus TaxID=210409 RepID=A0A5B7F1Y4_PORTR|nr:hypothetical protein [Portunus trituberculatus]
MKAQVGHSEMTVKGSQLIILKVNAVKMAFFSPKTSAENEVFCSIGRVSDQDFTRLLVEGRRANPGTLYYICIQRH